MLVSTNGTIYVTSAVPIVIGNGSGVTLYASAANGNVYLSDAVNESVTLTTAATTGTSLGFGSFFSLNTEGSILQDTPGSTSISSPTAY